MRKSILILLCICGLLFMGCKGTKPSTRSAGGPQVSDVDFAKQTLQLLADGEVRLPDSNRTYKQWAGRVDWIILDEPFGAEPGSLQRWMDAFVDLEVRQRAMLITRWNTGFLQQPL